jgi:flavin-dependent dehydrogenase
MIYDAIGLGAGPAGATAALLLARAGWTVAVVEKRTFPRRKVCGEFVSATTMPLLHELGVARDFLALAGPEVRRVGLFAGARAPVATMPRAAHPQGGWGWGRALGREHLDGLLLDAARAAGARVWQPWTAKRLTPSATGYTCMLADGSRRAELCARLFVAACGSWERGPLTTGAARTHRRSDLLAFKAHFRDSDLPPDLMPLLVFPGGYGGMVTSDRGRVSLSCCIRRDTLRQLRREGRLAAGQAVFRHIRSASTAVDDCLRRATLEQGWLAAGPIRPGIRGGIRGSFPCGVFAVGNLAGEAHPIVAEGISMAMQSAWLLCHRLTALQSEIGSDGALDQVALDYATAWRVGFAARIRAAAAFAHIAQRPPAAAAPLMLLARFPVLLTFGARLSGKVTQVVPPSVAAGEAQHA